MDHIPPQRKRLMMDPTEFWSSQFATLRPSTPGPSAVNGRSSSVDLDDPLLSASPSQLNAPEKSESRQRLAVVLKSPKHSHQYSWSEGDGNGQGSRVSRPSQQGTPGLASRAKKETPVPLPRQIVKISPPEPATRPSSTSRLMPTPAQPQRLPTKPFSPASAAAATSSKPAPKSTPVPLPKQLNRPSISSSTPAPTVKATTATTSTSMQPPLSASSPISASQPNAGRGRPKGWKPGMSYNSIRGPNSVAKPVRQAKPKTLALGPAKRRGRPPKAPSPLPWQVYRSLEKSFAAFLCEWGSCRAELHNLNTLRRHISVVHCRKRPFVCRWGKCGEEMTAVAFSDERSLRIHIEEAHLIPFSWHVGDGPQNDSSQRQLVDEEEIPDYLKDEHGNQVTPSIRDQEVEDFATWKSNRQKLKNLLVRMNENLPSEESDSLDDD
ncbi:hypothetical protein HDV64DRAFT_245384, partial [Trichoderma sp. TUCIM 5745]